MPPPLPQQAMLEFFPQLLSLAQLLLRSPAEQVQQAGSELYCCLFKHFTECFNQQVCILRSSSGSGSGSGSGSHNAA